MSSPSNFLRQMFGRRGGGASSPPEGSSSSDADGTTPNRNRARTAAAAAAAASDDDAPTAGGAGSGTSSSSPQQMFASFLGSARAAAAAAAHGLDLDGSGLEAAIAASLRDQQQQQQRHHGGHGGGGGGGGGGGQSSTTKAPPASEASIRNLPVIDVRKEDLVDPTNRECCICLDEHRLHSRAVRLPCAHLFHAPCIQDWLSNHSCTCPVCRYELPTNDAEFERHRQERMRHRKPRFARHELERLSNRQLKQLLLPNSSRRQRRPHFLDRKELIDYIVESGAIDLVAAPPPVEYPLSLLKAMKASELRRVMNEEAGVFFDPKDVVEKQDMINIFVMSGRLTVLPEEGADDDDEQADDVSQDAESLDVVMEAADEAEEVDQDEEEEDDRKPAAVPRGPVVETVLHDEEGASPSSSFVHGTQPDLRHDTTLVMEENSAFLEPPAVVVPVVATNDDERETTASQHDETEQTNGGESTVPPLSQTTPTADVDAGQDNNGNAAEEVAAATTSGAVETEQPAASVVEEEEVLANAVSAEKLTREVEEDSTLASEPRGRKRPHNENNGEDMNSSNNSSTEVGVPSSYSYSAPSQPEAAAGNNNDVTSSSTSIEASFQNLSVSELRRLGQLHSVDLAGCIEKHEMVRKLSSSVNSNQSETGSMSSSTHNDVNDENHDVILEAIFDDWDISEILTVASLLDIDLYSSPSPSSSTSISHGISSTTNGGNSSSTGRDRSQLIQTLLHACRDRPHMARYLQALAPMARLTVPQLRARARADRVDVSDCLEKGDLLRRLLQHNISSSTTAHQQQQQQSPSTTSVH